MSIDAIPEDVQSFLLEHIESYEELHLLLLLHRHPDQRFTAEAAAEASRIPASAAEVALDALDRRGLAESGAAGGEPAWRYSAESPATRDIVERLARAYADSPVEILRQMNANALVRVRTSAIRAFANAFVMRRRKRDG